MQCTHHLNNLTLTLSHPSAGLSCRIKIIFSSFALKMCGADLAAMRDWALKTLSFLCYGRQIESQVPCNDISQCSNLLASTFFVIHIWISTQRGKSKKITIQTCRVKSHFCNTDSVIILSQKITLLQKVYVTLMAWTIILYMVKHTGSH